MTICEHCGLPIQWLPDMSLFGDKQWCPGHPELLQQTKHETEAQHLIKDMAELLEECKDTFMANQHPGDLLTRIDALRERVKNYEEQEDEPPTNQP